MVICDASVLFKVAVAEPKSDRAVALVMSTTVVVPEFVFLEIGNALWNRVQRDRLQESEASQLLSDIRGLDLDVRPIFDLVAPAFAFANAIRHPIYDCAYLALAESLSAPLVSADQRLLTAVRRIALPTVDVIALADVR